MIGLAHYRHTVIDYSNFKLRQPFSWFKCFNLFFLEEGEGLIRNVKSYIGLTFENKFLSKIILIDDHLVYI